jgi:hypothetical protein
MATPNPERRDRIRELAAVAILQANELHAVSSEAEDSLLPALNKFSEVKSDFVNDIKDHALFFQEITQESNLNDKLVRVAVIAGNTGTIALPSSCLTVTRKQVYGCLP